MADVPCPLCRRLVTPSPLDSHLRSELAYAAWRCGFCALHFLSLPEARLHFHPRITRHLGLEENIVERADLAKEIRIADLLESAGVDGDGDRSACEVSAVKLPAEAIPSPKKLKLPRKCESWEELVDDASGEEAPVENCAEPQAEETVANGSVSSEVDNQHPTSPPPPEVGLISSDSEAEASHDQLKDEAFLDATLSPEPREACYAGIADIIDECEDSSEPEPEPGHQPFQGNSANQNDTFQSGWQEMESDGLWLSEHMDSGSQAQQLSGHEEVGPSLSKGTRKDEASSSLTSTPAMNLEFGPAKTAAGPVRRKPGPRKPLKPEKKRFNTEQKFLMSSAGRSRALEEPENSAAETAVMRQFSGQPRRFPDWMTQELFNALPMKKFPKQSGEGEIEQLWGVFGFFVKGRETADAKRKAKDLLRRLGFSLPYFWVVFRMGLRRGLASWLVTCFRLAVAVYHRLPLHHHKVFSCTDGSLEGDWDWTMEKVLRHCAYISPDGRCTSPLVDWVEAYSFFCAGAPEAAAVDVGRLLAACRHLYRRFHRSRLRT